METQLLRQKLKNITTGTKYITSLIVNQPLNIPFRNEELELLLYQHPNTDKVTDIDYLIVKIRPPYNTKSLYVKNKNEDVEQDVSYKYCLKALFGKYSLDKNNHDRIMRAFRDAVGNSGKKRKFFEETAYIIDIDGNYNGMCSKCNKHDKIHIDHHNIPFQQILDNFIQEQDANLIFSKIEVCENNNMYEFTDKEMENSWIEYHDNHVEYRALCPPCNMSLGSYGYKKIKNLYNKTL